MYHSLTDREIALEYFRSASHLAGSPTPPAVQARILGALGNAYAASSRLPRISRLLAAVDCYHRAAEIYLAERELGNWAYELNNLGLAECELAEEGFPNRWKRLWTRSRRRFAYAPTKRTAGSTRPHFKTWYRLPVASRRGPPG